MIKFPKTMRFFLGAKSQITIKYSSHMRTSKIIHNNWVYLFFSKTQCTWVTWTYFYTYEVCLKSNETVHVAQKNVLWFRKLSFSILWQLHSFLHVFLSSHFLCDRLWKFDKIKNFWLFSFFDAKDERQTRNQPEISCPS